MQSEPILDLAHLGHLELLTPKPDESLKFFVDVMGMTVSGRVTSSNSSSTANLRWISPCSAV